MNAARGSRGSGILAKAAALSSGSRGRHGRKYLAAIIMLILACGGSYFLWDLYGKPVTKGPLYTLSLENLQVTPQPAWIQADVRAEVFRDASWNQSQLSLLDHELTLKIAQAFQTHSWVAQVKRVTKHYPARVDVQLVYRRPVAMVKVNFTGQSGLLPVDTEGVLLPPDDFSATQAGQYPRIVADQASPSGPVGTPWGDSRVEGAARIAALLGAHWSNLKLYRIVASAPDGSNSRQTSEPTYQLQTRSRIRIPWGHAPGRETKGEPAASIKVARLINYVKRHGPLDQEKRSIQIDLRNTAARLVIPKTSRAHP